MYLMGTANEPMIRDLLISIYGDVGAFCIQSWEADASKLALFDSLKLSVLTSEIYSACKIQIECVHKPVCASCNSTSWFGHVGFDDHFLRWGKFLFR